MSDDNKKSVIEIIRNDNSDYFLSEVEKLRKELFDLSKSINEEIGNLKNTDSMRYNKINYDVFKKVDVLDLRTANINETMNKKAITDEKNRRNVLSKIQELYKGTISQINEKYNSLKDVLDLLEIDNSEKINDITKSIKENLTLVDENLKKKEYELLEIFSSDLTKLNEQLSIYIDEKNRISEDNLLELEEVFTEHFENISGNIDRISENFKIELKNVNETFESVKKDINGLNNTQETNYNYILEYFSKLEENSVLLEKDLKSAINDKLDSKKFVEYIDESTKKYSLLGSDLKTLRENFTNISKNIIDKIALTTEASLNSTQIQELIIQLLEEKFNNKVETITIIKEENEEKINTIKDELKVINESIENDLSNTISNFETKFKKQISDIERQLRNFEKNGVKKEDIEQIVKDNPEMFKGEKGEIPDHKYSNGWLFFQKPDGEWGTPIKVKSNDEERRMPTFASSGGMGGGAIGGSLDKYYLTKMFDVDSTGSNTDKSILTYSASENKFVFVHSINDSGTSTSDLWTADKIINHVSGVAGNYIPLSEKGQANGVAPLNVNRKIDAEYLPDSVVEYKGTWNASTNTPTLADGTGNDGDFYVTSVAGTHTFGGVSISFTIGDWVMYRGGIWKKDQNTDLSGYVKYSNNTDDLDMGEYGITQEYSKFNIDSVESVDADDGKLDWDEYYKTLKLKVPRSFYDTPEPETPEIYLINQQLKAVTYNPTRGYNHKGWALSADYTDQAASSDLKALITDVCYISDEDDAEGFIGIASEDNKASRIGGLTSYGIIENMNTSYFTRGDKLWLCDATEENHRLYYTNSEPIPPLKKVFVGWVTKVGTTDGVIFIDKRIFPRLSELSGMYGTLNTTGQIYTWNEEQGYFEVNDNLNLTAGCVVLPTITYEEDKGALTGNVILGNGTFTVYSGNKGESPLKRYEIAGATYTLTQNSKNYIIFNGNTGTIQVITNRDTPTLINQLDVIPIYTLYCLEDKGDISIFSMNWDDLSFGLSNKIVDCLTRTERWRQESGILLTTDSTNFTISSGYLWYGGSIRKFVDTFVSNNDTLYLWYLTETTTWNREIVTGFDNKHYNDVVTGLESLGINKWVNNWVYRAVLDDGSKHSCIVLSTTQYNKLSEALEESIPTNIPTPFQSLGVLVGRITVKENSTNTVVQSAWSDVFEYMDVSHNQLSGLQGGDDATDEFYHLTSAERSVVQATSGTNTGDFEVIKEIITLTSDMITNKYVDLVNTPRDITNVQVIPVGGISQEYLVDYSVITDGVSIKRLNWSGLGLDGFIIAGEKLQVIYTA